MEKFRAIKIIHDIGDRIDFLFLAEFFRLCGLYVGEGVFSEGGYFEEQDCSCFDAFIFTPNPKNFFENSQFIELDKKVGGLVRYFDIRKNFLPAGMEIHQCTPNTQQMLLTKCLDMVVEKIDAQVVRIDWQPLVRVYTVNNLMLHSSSLQYYSQIPSKAVQEALYSMMTASEELDELEALAGQKWDPRIDDYVRYARIWCKVKTNTCCEYQRKALFFSPVELAEECQKLYTKYPDFSNAVVLKGLCFEHSKDKANEAINAFLKALDHDKAYCYSTAIYYWLGKRYEAYEARQEDAEYYYQKAYEKKKKFRNIYKLAMYENNRKDYNAAESYYRQILDILDKRRKNRGKDGELNMLDPLELEYEFKSCRQMCIMFFTYCPDVTVKYRKTIQYAKRAITIKENDIDNSLMYERLYGKGKMQEYRNISKKRMELKHIYHILYLAYSETQAYDLAKEYRRKMEED